MGEGMGHMCGRNHCTPPRRDAQLQEDKLLSETLKLAYALADLAGEAPKFNREFTADLVPAHVRRGIYQKQKKEKQKTELQNGVYSVALVMMTDLKQLPSVTVPARARRVEHNKQKERRERCTYTHALAYICMHVCIYILVCILVHVTQQAMILYTNE